MRYIRGLAEIERYCSLFEN